MLNVLTTLVQGSVNVCIRVWLYAYNGSNTTKITANINFFNHFNLFKMTRLDLIKAAVLTPDLIDLIALFFFLAFAIIIII